MFSVNYWFVLFHSFFYQTIGFYLQIVCISGKLGFASLVSVFFFSWSQSGIRHSFSPATYYNASFLEECGMSKISFHKHLSEWNNSPCCPSCIVTRNGWPMLPVGIAVWILPRGTPSVTMVMTLWPPLPTTCWIDESTEFPSMISSELARDDKNEFKISVF